MPGNETFQSTLVASHVTGNVPVARLAMPSGPRHVGHSPGVSALVAAAATNTSDAVAAKCLLPQILGMMSVFTVITE